MRPSDRLLRRGIPKTDIRKELENWSDGLSRWERFWTAVVLGGLAVEVFVRIDRFLPHSIFDLIWPHSSWLGDIGDAIVFVGVFGELVVASKVGRIETALREENAKVISETEERAAKALERAANAERAAAEAKLERIRLEASFKRRTLDRKLLSEEESLFILAVSPFAGQKFSLQANPPPYDGTITQIERHSEQMSFANQLRDLLLSAKWVQEAASPDDLGVRSGVTTFVPLISGPPPPGHTIPPVVSAAWELSFGLQRFNIAAQVVFKKDSPDHVAVIGVGLL